MAARLSRSKQRVAANLDGEVDQHRVEGRTGSPQPPAAIPSRAGRVPRQGRRRTRGRRIAGRANAARARHPPANAPQWRIAKYSGGLNSTYRPAMISPSGSALTRMLWYSSDHTAMYGKRARRSANPSSASRTDRSLPQSISLVYPAALPHPCRRPQSRALLDRSPSPASPSAPARQSGRESSRPHPRSRGPRARALARSR